MGLGEVQAALARLSVETTLRDRFFADPAAVGSELGLDAAEALGLGAIPRRHIDQFADSLHGKRRDQMRRVVPIATRALGRQFAALFRRYIDESPPRGSKAELDDAAGFVAAIRRWADQIEPPWAADLARYELAWRQAARAGWMPIVRTFRYPVARLVTGQEPEPVKSRPTIACWWRLTPRGKVRHRVVSFPMFGSSGSPSGTAHTREVSATEGKAEEPEAQFRQRRQREAF
jgi:hypothetical protein